MTTHSDEMCLMKINGLFFSESKSGDTIPIKRTTESGIKSLEF